jgi:probable rRNA maturation factor
MSLCRPTPEPRQRLGLTVELHNDVAAPLDPALLRQLARRVLAAEGRTGRYLLTVHVADDEALRQANWQQRGVDAPTDVLSFPLLPELQRQGDAFALPPGAPRHLGDVLISYERAVAQAAAYGHSVERELGYLLVHGILHVLGYDHEAEDERQQMREREEAVLAPLGLTR